MEKIWNQILILIPFIFISCTNSTDKIIRKVCTELTYHEKNMSIISYLMVTEQSIKSHYSTYTIDSNIYQKGDSVIKYTKYFKLNGVYVFIRQKDKPELLISPKIQEEIYNFGKEIKYESPQYILIIDLSNNEYKLFNDYEELLSPYDSLSILSTKELELMFHD